MDTKVRHNGSSAATITSPGRSPGQTGTVLETVAGALLSITGIGLILSIITNEALYPAARHYTTFANEISDLGGTKPPDSYMVQPNRLIFIVSMAVAGALVLIATYLLWRVIQRRRFLVALGLLGIGLVGIAVFPGNVATYHVLFSLVSFVGGSVARSCHGRSWMHLSGTSRWHSDRLRFLRRCSVSTRLRTGDPKRRSGLAESSDGSLTRSSYGWFCWVASS